MVLSEKQLREKYSSYLTPEDLIAEQKLMYETDDVLDGTGLECGSRVQTKDGEGVISGFVTGLDGSISLLICTETINRYTTRCYDMDEILQINASIKKPPTQ